MEAQYRFKKILFAVVLCALMLPLVQQHVKFYHSEKLKGAIVPVERAWFTLDGWWSGSYQEQYEKWYNENFGFRPDFVRIHNQIAYSLYNEAKANSVIIGKSGYLYEWNYIKTYTGRDFEGEGLIAERIAKIKALQDTLGKKGITLVVCLAPGKASYFPEFIPDEYGPAADSTNYKSYARLLGENNVNMIDFNAWFMQMKGNTEYPLYPKTGIHWSRYGSTLAIDSFIRYVEKKRNVNMPNMIIDRVAWCDTMRSPDEDIGVAMNLLFKPRGFAMAYPEYHFEDTSGKAHVSMMAISDSYFWNMFDIGLAPSSFSDICFYYYNKEVYHSDNSPFAMSELDASMNDFASHDVVMLMSTEGNIWGLGWGIVEDAYNKYVLHIETPEHDKLVRAYETSIRMDDKWMSDIRKKAAEKNIPLDSMIYLDAKFMADDVIKNQQK